MGRSMFLTSKDLAKTFLLSLWLHITVDLKRAAEHPLFVPHVSIFGSMCVS